MNKLTTEILPSERSGIARFNKMIAAYIAGLLDRKPSTGTTMVEIDGLRGFAATLVIAAHTNLWHLREQGALGVWLFYVLSGFLLTKIMLQKIPGSLGGREMAKYIIRRIARIIPPYFTCLLLVALIDGKSWDWLLRHFTFRQADWVFWSIPQEELFYLVLPALVAVVYLLKRWVRLPASLSAGIIVVYIVRGFPFFALPGNGTLVQFYINIFILGFFLAFIWSVDGVRKVRKSTWFLPFANFAGIACLVILLLAAKEQLAYYHKFVPVPVGFLGWEYPTTSAAICGLLLFSTLTPGSWTQRLFASPALRVLGVLSFSLYLVHWSIFQNLMIRAKFKEGFGLFMVTLFLSLIVALIFERFIERPSMRFGRKISSYLGGTPVDPAVKIEVPNIAA